MSFIYLNSFFMSNLVMFSLSRIALEDFVTHGDVTEIFMIWLKAIDQNQRIQGACIVQLQIYLIRICTDILHLESNGQ